MFAFKLNVFNTLDIYYISKPKFTNKYLLSINLKSVKKIFRIQYWILLKSSVRKLY